MKGHIWKKIRDAANCDQNNVCNSQKPKNILQDKKGKVNLKKSIVTRDHKLVTNID